jgi:hypothetical protein
MAGLVWPSTTYLTPERVGAARCPTAQHQQGQAGQTQARRSKPRAPGAFAQEPPGQQSRQHRAAADRREGPRGHARPLHNPSPPTS